MNNKKTINNVLKKLDSLPEAEEVKDIALKATSKHQKKYGFEMPSGKESTHNNEADAFKHAYWQAYSRYFEGVLTSKGAGILHELTNPKQPKGELNMDLWNNRVGQEIGKEISERVKGMENMFNLQAIKDYIADMVIQKTKAGDFNYKSE